MNRILIFISIVLLALITCSSMREYETVTTFEIERGLPVLDVTINGKDTRLIIDTGATSSVLNMSSAYEYKYDCKMFESYYAAGITGTSSIGIVNNVDFEINGNNVLLNFKCVDLNELSKRMNVLGILGNDYFSRNELIIDYYTLEIKRKL